MRDQSAWNMYIFRDGRSKKAGPELLRDLTRSLQKLELRSADRNQTQLLDALLRAGELECALADAKCGSVLALKIVTDKLAAALVGSEAGPVELDNKAIMQELDRVKAPHTIEISPPEGFAYYALHPLSYVDLLRELPKPRYAAVIGIRSIGTTLSSVVGAGLRSFGVPAERITVRPTGHPYDRTTTFSYQQKRWIGEQRAREAQFFVVDEGPGMSGSSFLSVGDALLAAGVERSQIIFLCSRAPDPLALTAHDGAARWTSYRSLTVAPNRRLPTGADEFIAGGIWRKSAFADESDWPASWTQMERLKFLSRDGSRLLKFDGYGRFGAEVRSRAESIAAGGFGIAPVAVEQGFSIYPVVQGKWLHKADVSADVIAQIASYCAYRAREVRSKGESLPELRRMFAFNFLEEFGIETNTKLELERPVIADGRMLPHKWIRTRDGRLLKIDNASHGDDHFFPGPTDIAWDLAGAIVEWKMGDDAAQMLLRLYKSRSGDDAAKRLSAYLQAYSVFRMGYCKMAAVAMRGLEEEIRLSGGYQSYRQSASEYSGNAVETTSSLRLVAEPELSPVVPVKLPA